MSPSPSAARPLTSREISKLMAAFFAGFVDISGAESVIEALDHFIEHRDVYAGTWRGLETVFKAADLPDTTAGDNEN